MSSNNEFWYYVEDCTLHKVDQKFRDSYIANRIYQTTPEEAWQSRLDVCRRILEFKFQDYDKLEKEIINLQQEIEHMENLGI